VAPRPAGESARRWHAAVAEASSRTVHTLDASAAPRDDRYTSADPDVDALWLAMHEVADPELPISLVDLGLIRDIRRERGDVDVDVTFTASACPCMEFIMLDIRERLLREPGVERVTVRDVWDPPWTRDAMTEHGRALLRSFGVSGMIYEVFARKTRGEPLRHIGNLNAPTPSSQRSTRSTRTTRRSGSTCIITPREHFLEVFNRRDAGAER
jgi:metal-sulfur cluster biosynthetic enzyme